MDSAALVGGDDARIVLANRLHPHLQDVVLIGRQPRQPFAVGRDMRIGALRIPEQSVARNQRRQLSESWVALELSKS